MFWRDDSAHLCFWIQRIAQSDPRQLVDHPRLECLGYARLDNQARAGHAALPRVKAKPEGNAIGGIVKIGVGKNQLRIFPAQFQRDLLEIGFRRLQDPRAHRAGAGKRDHINVRMG